MLKIILNYMRLSQKIKNGEVKSLVLRNSSNDNLVKHIGYKIITSCNIHENILKVKKYFGYKQVTGGKETNSNMN